MQGTVKNNVRWLQLGTWDTQRHNQVSVVLPPRVRQRAVFTLFSLLT